jgi:hypothetical protein
VVVDLFSRIGAVTDRAALVAIVVVALMGYGSSVVKHVVSERHKTKRYRMTTRRARPSSMAEIVHALERGVGIERPSEDPTSE